VNTGILQEIMVRGVLFDLGGVVLNSPFEAIAALEGELSLERGTINHVIGSSGDHGAFARLERGELTSSSFAVPFSEDCARAGLPASAVSLLDGSMLIRRITAACTPRPLMIDALKVLKEAPGLKTAAVTNNFLMADEASNFAATSEIVPLFDDIVESAITGLRKPDPAIYKLACERLSVEPADCVFIDDIGRNLKPAQAMGMQTIRCAVEDATGARALGKLATLLGGDVGRRLTSMLRLASKL
jgi:putative hydrolase of the HAD superfamily